MYRAVYDSNIKIVLGTIVFTVVIIITGIRQ